MRILLAIIIVTIGSVAHGAPYRVTTVGPNMTVRILGPSVPKKRSPSYFMRPPYNPVFDGRAGGRAAAPGRVSSGRGPDRKYQGPPLIIYNPYVKQKPKKPKKQELYLIFGTSDPIGYWE